MLNKNGASKVYLCTLLVTAIVGFILSLHSGSSVKYIDEVEYLSLASHLANGRGYVSDALVPTAFRPPGYPFFMAFFVNLPNGVFALKLINVILLLGSLHLIKMIVDREVPDFAWVAGGAALVYPVWLYTASTLYPQTLCLFLLLAVVVLLLKKDLSMGGVLGAGFLYGYLILVAAPFAFLGPALLLAIPASGWGKKLALSAVFTSACLLILTPWVYRNFDVMGKFVPVSTNGGINLLKGNSEFAGANTGVDVDVYKYYFKIQHITDEVDRSRAMQKMAVEWMIENPRAAFVLYLKKALNYYNFMAEVKTANHGAGWKDWVMFISYYPVLVLVLMRFLIFSSIPVSRVEWVLLGLYVLNGLAAALFFTRIRFRLPLDGLLMALAIISFGRIWGSRVAR